jgi:anti-sigma B factor antagonist
MRESEEIMHIITREAGDVVVFDIVGEIRRSNAIETTLHQVVKSQLEQGRRDILFNLENVDFIDSFGVGEILASYISIQSLGGKIKLVRISKKLGVVFKVVGLDRVLEVFENEITALQSFIKP